MEPQEARVTDGALARETVSDHNLAIEVDEEGKPKLHAIAVAHDAHPESTQTTGDTKQVEMCREESLEFLHRLVMGERRGLAD